MRIEPGQLVAGKYELIRPLGHGSMGAVWLARHRTLSEQVAIKMISDVPVVPDVEDTATVSARFRQEARLAAQLSRRTRHIVRVTDHGEEDGIAYLVMELLEGETLADFIERRGCLALAETAALVTQIGRALGEAHKAGVIHRDLKPANVFVTRDEDGAVLVKLLDFGIARLVRGMPASPSFATADGLVFGTPGYMSPEQASPACRPDPRCDLWALATVAYEALSGDLPLDGASTEELLGNLCAGNLIPLRARKPGLPSALDAFFARAFARDPGDRFTTARELVAAFGRAARGEAPFPGASSAPRASSSPPPPRRWLLATAGGLLWATGIAAPCLALWALAGHPASASTSRAPAARGMTPASAETAPLPVLVAGAVLTPAAEAESLAPIPDAPVMTVGSVTRPVAPELVRAASATQRATNGVGEPRLPSRPSGHPKLTKSEVF